MVQKLCCCCCFSELYCFASRDGLLFELENGKPKLILLSGGKKSASLYVKLVFEVDINMDAH